MMIAGLSALTVALWVAICAAAPEFIWQGLRVVLAHPSLADLLSALLIGLVLACFVEPMMERGRDLLERTRHQQPHHARPRNVLFTASLSLAFALVSVCLHDAIAGFVSGRTAEQHGSTTALVAGIMLAVEWAIVPFAVTLAWLSAGNRLFAIPTAVIACVSASIAGWLFTWPANSVITTTIPCLIILAIGYRRVRQEPARHALTRCARSLAGVAVLWLAVALILDAVLERTHLERFMPYTATDFWTDVRFYLGWALGLLLVPPLTATHAATATTRVPPS